VDRIKQMLDTITELTDDQIVDLQAAIVSEFESVEGEDPTPQTVETMTTLADMLDTVRAESKRRVAQAEELAARAAEASTRVKGEAADMEEEKAAEGEEPAEAPETPAEEAPAPEMEEEKKEEEKMEMQVEAATEATVTEEKASELSTETSTPEAPAAVETPAEVEAVVADAAVETPAEVVAESTTTTTSEAQDVQKVEEPLVAATENTETVEVTDIQAPADRRPQARVEAAPVAITAGADIPGYTAGSSLKDMKEVAEVMAKRLHGLRRVNGGDGEQHIVASFTTSYPEERILTQDAESNWAKVQAVTGPEALVASGGHSAPFEVKYDIFGLGTTARPVRDALPRFSADRGGIRFVVPPVLSSYGSAVGVWTNPQTSHLVVRSRTA